VYMHWNRVALAPTGAAVAPAVLLPAPSAASPAASCVEGVHTNRCAPSLSLHPNQNRKHRHQPHRSHAQHTHISESQPQPGLSILPRRPCTSTTCTYEPGVIGSRSATCALPSSLPVGTHSLRSTLVSLKPQARRTAAAAAACIAKRAFAQDRLRLADEAVVPQLSSRLERRWFGRAVRVGSHRRRPLHRCVGRRARQAGSHRTAARSVRRIGHRLHRWRPLAARLLMLGYCLESLSEAALVHALVPSGACCDRRCRRSSRAAARSIGRQPRRQLRRRRPHKQMRAVLVSAPKPEP
jgi:hypothetical protein